MNPVNDPNYDVLRTRLKAAVLREGEAPPALAARIREQIKESQAPKQSWWFFRFPAMSAAAAAVVMALGGTLVYQLGQTALQDSYIASIASRIPGIMSVGLKDHVHCTVYRKFPKVQPGLDELAAKLEPRFRPLATLVSQKVGGDFKVVLAHECGYQGRRFIHIALNDGKSLASLVIAAKREGESFEGRDLVPVMQAAGAPVYQTGVDRFNLASFETREHLAYFVSDMDQEANLKLAVLLAPEVRGFLESLS